jgi:hypothetical protein
VRLSHTVQAFTTTLSITQVEQLQLLFFNIDLEHMS